MKEISVTYTLNDDELKQVEALAKHANYDVDRYFIMMMTTGSKYDIQDKLAVWERMERNYSSKLNK